jgi:hypothetical protein
VFATSVSKDPEPFFTEILYPVIGEPPSLEGALQESVIWVGDAATAVRLPGAPGVLAEEDAVGVADDSAEIGLIPTELIAETR